MKTFFKKIFTLIAIFATIGFSTALVPTTFTYAESNNLGSCRELLLGLVSWDCHIDPEMSSEEDLTTNIIIIASNVLTDLTVIAEYLTFGFIVWGGYQYIFSSGDAGKVAKGKKTLTNAFIGLAIVLLANVILNTIRIILMGQNGSFAVDCTTGTSGIPDNCVTDAGMVANIFNWFFGSAGVVAFIFIFMGGFSYMTSAGDSAKLQKAKQTILYAVIGLAIVILALAINNFVTATIQRGRENSTASLLISPPNKKELYEG